jgi:glucose/arabinose dehydrogenase
MKVFLIRPIALVIVVMLVCVSLGQGSEPEIHRDGVTAKRVLEVGAGNVRLVHNPANNELYLLSPEKGVLLLDLGAGSSTLAATLFELDGNPTGMTFGQDGTLYIVTNKNADDTHNQATIHRGISNDKGRFDWEIVAQTEPYPLSQTYFDHMYNGIVVSPDGQYLFINAGSRTDHGEVQTVNDTFPETREVALTTKILRLPIDAKDLVLANDETVLADYIFARGTRNAYDMAFAPNGDLFAVDNGPDADYPDELNWLREGLHYGFPWRFGDQDNPQQFSDYDSSSDKLQNSDFEAVKRGFYQNDPDFPKAPSEFTNPIKNLGPDAAIYRADDGSEKNAAAEGEALYTFTPHISPLGLVFIEGEMMPSDLQSTDTTLSAFVVSWGAAGGTLSDKGQNLLHLSLTKQDDNYEMVTTEVASGFVNPIDAVLIGNKLYVLEYGSEGAIWELTFEE